MYTPELESKNPISKPFVRKYKYTNTIYFRIKRQVPVPQFELQTTSRHKFSLQIKNEGNGKNQKEK
jgi:hypothetical protein